MLVLSRKRGEQIRIGDDIVVTVQRLKGNRVTIGIDAPPECKIKRGELDDPIGPPGGAPPQASPVLPAAKRSQKPSRVHNHERRAAS